MKRINLMQCIKTVLVENIKYPLADISTWWSDCDYHKRGGKLEWISPRDFLKLTPKLDIDESSRENIEDIKNHIIGGKKLDPLVFYKCSDNTRNSDGRHRAVAAMELGITRVPVLNFMGHPINLNEAKLTGGKSEGMSLKDIAKKHNVEFSEIQKQFKMGVKVEMEHTDNIEIAKNIAKDHIFEDQKYYSKLKKIEKK